jgi:hypothetical protein
LDGGREPVTAGGVQTRRLYQLSSMMIGIGGDAVLRGLAGPLTRSTQR